MTTTLTYNWDAPITYADHLRYKNAQPGDLAVQSFVAVFTATNDDSGAIGNRRVYSLGKNRYAMPISLTEGYTNFDSAERIITTAGLDVIEMLWLQPFPENEDETRVDYALACKTWPVATRNTHDIEITYGFADRGYPDRDRNQIDLGDLESTTLHEITAEVADMLSTRADAKSSFDLIDQRRGGDTAWAEFTLTLMGFQHSLDSDEANSGEVWVTIEAREK